MDWVVVAPSIGCFLGPILYGYGCKMTMSWYLCSWSQNKVVINFVL